MSIQGVTAASVISSVAEAAPRAGGATSGVAGFGKMLAGMVNEVDNKQAIADTAIEKLVTGAESNVHDVALSMAKADISFQLFMEIRNRLIDSYQEIMRMQV